MKKYKGIKEYISPYPNSILFKKGEIIKPGKEYKDNPNWKNWIWCEGQNKNKAWVPKQFLSFKNNKCILMQNFDAQELSVSFGEELIAFEGVNGFVKVKKLNGAVGWAPLENLIFIGNKSSK